MILKTEILIICVDPTSLDFKSLSLFVQEGEIYGTALGSSHCSVEIRGYCLI